MFLLIRLAYYAEGHGRADGKESVLQPVWGGRGRPLGGEVRKGNPRGRMLEGESN